MERLYGGVGEVEKSLGIPAATSRQCNNYRVISGVIENNEFRGKGLDEACPASQRCALGDSVAYNDK
jgi:hypothetical protein